MARQSRREYLQQLLDARRSEDAYEFDVTWQGAAGWWAVPCESRWFGDRGEFLGHDWQTAANALQYLF